jgi:ligand-binding sensor domain-containing protein/anti-sigma regulatory factor (Ser/Thr protein kinase)
MRYKFLLAIFFLYLGLAHVGYAQSYNYVTYTTRDGLAGNMVYDMCQDHQGFLWFGTDNGLSRFDGKHFRNYSVKDGLPDNEVLQLYTDSRQRIWLGTFSDKLSYYYQGKIYTANTDSVLRKIKLNSKPSGFFETFDSTLWIIANAQLFYWPKNGELKELVINPSFASRLKTSAIEAFPYTEDGSVLISFNDSTFLIKNDRLEYLYPIKSQSSVRRLKRIQKDSKVLMVDFGCDIIHATWRNGYPFLVGTVAGAFEIDSAGWEIKEKFLPNLGVTRALMDFENGYWFATLGDGVFKLPSKYALTYSLFQGLNAGNEVFSIAQRGDSILTGHGGSTLVVWKRDGKKTKYSFEQYLPGVENSIATNRLKAIHSLSNGKWLLGFDGFLILWDGAVRGLIPINATKTIAVSGDSIATVAAGQHALKIDLKRFEIIDTIWPTRTTCALPWNGGDYIGTLSGLYEVKSGNKLNYLGNLHPSLKRRIIAISNTNNSLWVATSDSGLVEIGNTGLIRTFSEKNGLTSNICRSLAITDNIMLVGTNKGLCRIDLNSENLNTIIYNSFNLLPHDAVSSVFMKGNQILVGSPAGLTVFEESDIKNNSLCNIEINGINGSGRSWTTDEEVVLSYDDNNLEIYYSGISMKSAGDIEYFYRLVGLDNNWNATRLENITYSGLPPGNYIFKIYAVNKFGVKSKVLNFSLKVNAPFWKSPWFLFSIMLGLGVISFFMLSLKNRRQRKILEENNRIQKQLASLEQKALQAQMNPHFIFNSLNAIQQYVLTNNVEDANRYLSIFAALIRETMENSSAGKISLDKEIAYIEKYLKLEQMRFGNSFNYSIQTEGLEHDEAIELPVMLLQPFIENAVRHGIRYLKSGEGLIEIVFEKQDNIFICKIRDNGKGRKLASEIKSKQHIEYQSRGMDLTQRRVEMLNNIYEEKISIFVKDILNASGAVAGTEVIITIIQPQNESVN